MGRMKETKPKLFNEEQAVAGQAACARCRFWTAGERETLKGHCRRSAPSPWHVSYIVEPKQGHPFCWPVTMHDDFCGEWRGRANG